MRREMSALAAAYSDDEEAAGDFEALKEDLPKVGRLVDRSKVILLATSDAPNEVDVEHIGGGPIGKLVEVAAGRGLKGRLAPGNAVIVGVVDPDVENEAFEALGRARGRAVVPVEEGEGKTSRRARRPSRRRWDGDGAGHGAVGAPHCVRRGDPFAGRGKRSC